MAKKLDSGELAAVGLGVIKAVRESGLGKLVGEVEYGPLASVKPNPWNPNVMTPDEQRALEYGLRHDGWLVSQALLVWGTDENGAERNVIIDGEHRWTAGGAIGFDDVPMVKLRGLTEAKAKKLTIAMNAKRGRHDDDLLKKLVRELDKGLAGLTDNLADDLGLSDESLAKMLADDAEEIAGNAPAERGERNVATMPGGTVPLGEIPSGKMAQVKMVQLFFDEEQRTAFDAAVRALAPQYGAANVTDVVREAVRREAARLDGGAA
jgi:hypothetical protein